MSLSNGDRATIQRDLMTISDDETAASTPSHGNYEAAPARRSVVGLSSWATMFQRSSSSGGGSGRSSSTVHVEVDQNRAAASMKVVAKSRVKPGTKKPGFLGSCLSLKL